MLLQRRRRRQLRLRAGAGGPPSAAGDPLEQGDRQLRPPHPVQFKRQGPCLDPSRGAEVPYRNYLRCGINLPFWDVLALVAFQHVEKGQQVFVSGRLVSDAVEGEEDRPRVYYKVVVQELNLIGRNLPPVQLYEPETNYGTSGAKFGDYAGNRGSGGSEEELWQAFFANPVNWWDNWMNKRNPKAPVSKYK